MGSKFLGPESSGPQSQWSKASGAHKGSLVFRFGL